MLPKVNGSPKEARDKWMHENESSTAVKTAAATAAIGAMRPGSLSRGRLRREAPDSLYGRWRCGELLQVVYSTAAGQAKVRSNNPLTVGKHVEGQLMKRIPLC